MKVLFISTDRKILDPDSAVSKRFVEYRKLFDELHTVLLNGKISGIFYAYNEAKKIIKNSRDVVASTQDPFETGVIGVLLKLFYDVPLQIQLHTDFRNKYFLFSTPLNFIRFFIAHFTLPFADSVRVVSKRIENNIIDLAKNVSILPIHTDVNSTNRESRRTGDKITILTVSRLEKEKDVESSIKAFIQISKKFPDAEFVVVGDGREMDKLKIIANDKVKFFGWIDDLREIYANADIYISTSLFEGYGMAVMEAALSGLPLVLSDAGVAGEIFKEGESAYISKPKDVVSFANSLEKLLGDENSRRDMGRAAKAAAEKSLIPKEEYLSKFKESITSTSTSSNENFISRVGDLIKKILYGNKILRFIAAGGTAAGSQILTLYILTDLINIHYLTSSVFAFIVGITLSFFLQKLWAFRDVEMKGAHIQFFKYFMVALIGLGINTVLMFTFVEVLNIWYILAQILTGVFIAVFNYLSYRKFIFNDV